MTGISEPTTEPEAAIWRGFRRSELDRAYDNAGHVRDSAAKLADWTARSALLRAARPEFLDLRYGPRDRNRIDVFRCGEAGAPLLVFIHGGYWQRNSKEVFSCLAEGPLARGFDVALPGYTLAPDASLSEIVDEIEAAIGWLREQGPERGFATGRLIVGGWSAGAHLAALACGWRGVDGGLLVSGIYDLEPIRLGILNEKLGLSEGDVGRLSPIGAPGAGVAPAAVIVGGSELPELQRQSADYAAARIAAGVPTRFRILPDRNHFTILDELSSPQGGLTEELAGFLSA
ncbi:alpha/beta hydrolase [Enterovirga rhinocerotis]|uniref:Acetyl esterase/lipase n=1 Tax=Enterovirga rhinocerotis TaxID=1339210 RepID=A0A4R7BTR0_9HYPH|nr:alpha/beta hydrolase [Enterovirga rhinocerotis]TDR88881.1 acetyl esterase/lipase [Enterovirga rhinocerotis]